MRKVGAEAPAAKVASTKAESIIGMIALNVQLIFYAKDIDTILSIVTECDKALMGQQKISFMSVCDNDLKKIEAMDMVQSRLKSLKLRVPLAPKKIKLIPNKVELRECFEFGIEFGEFINGKTLEMTL